MFETLPDAAATFMDWPWERIEPFYADLEARSLDAASVNPWLRDWTRLSSLVYESLTRLQVATSRDTNNADAERRLFAYMESIGQPAEIAEQRLKQKLLASGLQPAGLAVPLRSVRAEAELFREANVPLQTEERKLGVEYDSIVGAQTVQWDGAERPLAQMRMALEDGDRLRREQAWRLMSTRQLADRAALDDLWRRMFELRTRIAANAGLSDYRAYVWRAYGRFDYTPEDCAGFADAIEQVCVPAATKVYERHRERLGLARLRPWDLVDGWYKLPAPAPDQSALRPFYDAAELSDRGGAMLRRLDPELGAYYQTLVDEDLLDLDSRTGKAPGGYCTYFLVDKRPFIFMNAIGSHDDVRTIVHEAGHAFHAFESSGLPYYQQLGVPMEFAEVASMAMELLTAPYLSREQGGFYSEADAARARAEHLEDMLLFWPFMAVVDSFQHWAYTHPDAAVDAKRCDAEWRALWQRFIPAVDWTGLDDVLDTGWQRKLHIFHGPFYYVEYGMAALGAVHVWRNSLADQAAAIRSYRSSLALGGTATLPELYTAAGARFAFDADTLSEAVDLIERTVSELRIEN